MRETARVAMARLHFSRGLRKAMTSRSRNTTVAQPLEPGAIVYYFRMQKYNNKTSNQKKKLSLRRWHGPALLVANEGTTNCYVSHKGQLTKCAREHVRLASTMEQIASEVWRDAIDEIIEAATRDEQERQAAQQQQQQPNQPDASPAPGTEQQVQPLQAPMQEVPAGQQVLSDLPPVNAQEFTSALQAGASSVAPAMSFSMPSSLPSSLASSRRPSKPFADARRSGSPVGDLMARARDQARMDSIIERAHELDQPGAAGTKREAEMSLEELAQTVQPTDGGSASAEAPVSEAMFVGCVATAASAPETFESVSTNELSGKQLHPLRQLWLDAAQDQKNPLEHVVEDRGTWKGDWPLPTRSEWQMP